MASSVDNASSAATGVLSTTEEQPVKAPFLPVETPLAEHENVNNCSSLSCCARNIMLEQDYTTARCEDPLLLLTQSGDALPPGRTDSWSKIFCGFALLLFVPMPFCIAPILLPFGGVHHLIHPDIQTLLEKEWVYFLWYSPIGWASLYGSMAWWTARCLDIKSGVAPDSFYGLMMGTLLPTVLTCALFIAAGLWVFPTPLATLSIGAPSVAIWCLCVYVGTPSDWLEKPGNRCRLFGLQIYWILWFAELGLLAFCTYLSLTFKVSSLFAIGTFVGKLGIDGAVTASISRFHPAADIIDDDMTSEADMLHYRKVRGELEKAGHILGFLPIWMEYSIVVYQSFVFPVGGNMLTIMMLILASNIYEYRAIWQINWTSLKSEGKLTEEDHPRYFSLWQYLAPCSTSIVEIQLEQFYLRQFCECFAPVHFAFIFAFDVFLWNKQDMYNIDSVSEAKSWNVLAILAVTAMMQFTFAAMQIHYLLTNDSLADDHKKCMRQLIDSSCVQFVWLLVCATASIATIAGACMIMKHDGMDMAFHFDWLHAV
eukprot:TRINITY_DN10298_c0_g3_i3.p1 TRINITY_DN10298_c0_g3~~TRINITY_DN10298_c0_g3_i3.p1  ORF type:complete len:540 (+),score=65.99 TRINITY_DN10298_c0_g3_i3:68-1687(+)